MDNPVQAPYDAFITSGYTWVSGGREEQVQKNRKFFSFHAITPRDNRVAIDLGASCGFPSIPLAMLGFFLIAVDFCLPLLDELRTLAGALPVETMQSDILQFSS
jgi:hypothetical protein